MSYKLITTIILSLIICSSFISYSFASSERYDVILQALEEGKEIPPEKKEYINQLPPSKGKDLPKLSGIWKLKKVTLKRRDPTLTIPIVNKYCNAKLPIQHYDFEKEVVISEMPQGKFVIRSLYPSDKDIYTQPEKKDKVYSNFKNEPYTNSNTAKEVIYQNFGFKGVIDPEDLTYAYTLKLVNFSENPAYARELWLNGRLFYKDMDENSIEAKGYEVLATAKCYGTVFSEISFKLEKIKDI